MTSGRGMVKVFYLEASTLYESLNVSGYSSDHSACPDEHVGRAHLGNLASVSRRMASDRGGNPAAVYIHFHSWVGNDAQLDFRRPSRKSIRSG